MARLTPFRNVPVLLDGGTQSGEGGTGRTADWEIARAARQQGFRVLLAGGLGPQNLARATEDLHHRVAGENVQDAAIILEADIPLLRGAGLAAREDLIQSERDLIYAARDFEEFRRQFLFDIAREFLDLVLLQRGVLISRASDVVLLRNTGRA